MKTLNNSHKSQDFSLLVKYHGPTTHRGSRVSITSKRFNKNLTFSWDYSSGTSSLDQIGSILIENDIQVLSYSDLGEDDIIMISWEDGIELFNI